MSFPGGLLSPRHILGFDDVASSRPKFRGKHFRNKLRRRREKSSIYFTGRLNQVFAERFARRKFLTGESFSVEPRGVLEPPGIASPESGESLPCWIRCGIHPLVRVYRFHRATFRNENYFDCSVNLVIKQCHLLVAETGFEDYE